MNIDSSPPVGGWNDNYLYGVEKQTSQSPPAGGSFEGTRLWEEGGG